MPPTPHKIIDPDPATWDAFVRQHPRAHVLQLSAWGELKSAYGWEARRIALATVDEGRILGGVQLLLRPLPMRLGRMAYAGMGPLASDDVSLKAIWSVTNRQVTRERLAAFVKWEPGIYSNAAQPPEFRTLGFTESMQTIQPPRTILLDIRADDDTIMSRMNQGTRRKIRKSLKNDIHYYEATREDVGKFNAMMQATGQRNEFGVHEPGYYELAYDLFVPAGDAALLLAEHEGDVLAGLMVFAVGRTAWYLYGASSSEKRNLMATYGIQWEAIQWAKRRGCFQYDLWGVPDEDADTLEVQFQERSDGLWGVYGFKRGFGGEVVRSAGTWDRAYNSLVYRAYWGALKLRELNAQ